MTKAPSSFDGELVAFILEELDDLGDIWLTSGLESVLMDDSGEIQSTGVTQDMIDGSAAAALASCDMVAAAFGQGPEAMPAEIRNVVETHGQTIRATEGLPDLAAKVMAIISNPDHAKFGGTRGINASAEEFLSVAADVSDRIAKVAAEHPGEWVHEPLAEGTFRIRWSGDQ